MLNAANERMPPAYGCKTVLNENLMRKVNQHRLALCLDFSGFQGRRTRKNFIDFLARRIL
jgi:hypothetical protein